MLRSIQIDYVAHGEDIILGEDGEDIYKMVKDLGKYKTIKRTDGISTSDLILRIVKYVLLALFHSSFTSFTSPPFLSSPSLSPSLMVTQGLRPICTS